MDPNVLQHLLILCCYGGIPYIDYERIGGGDAVRNELSTPLDPTDWIAVDSSGMSFIKLIPFRDFLQANQS